MKTWKPKVGDKVYIVPNDDRELPHYVEITKVGRKYAYFDNDRMRIDLSNMSYSWNSTVYNVERGHVYKAVEHYKKETEMKEMRRFLRDNIQQLTCEQVATIYEWIKPKTL